MDIIRSLAELRHFRNTQSTNHRKLGFVPTMGALHAGHLALISAAKKCCDTVAVSIYVNPAQFGPNEDFETYPRQESRDLSTLAQMEVDCVYFPQTSEIYLPGNATQIRVEGLSDLLDLSLIHI